MTVQNGARDEDEILSSGDNNGVLPCERRRISCKRAGAGGQYLQLVRLHRRLDPKGFHQGNRHQGRLRRL